MSEAIRKIETLEEQIAGLREARNAAQAETSALEDNFAARLQLATERLAILAQAMGK